MANRAVMVEPPESAGYVVAAYEPGNINPNQLAWIQPTSEIAEDSLTGLGHEEQELLRLPRIAATPPDGGKEMQILGIVYADSPVADVGHTGKRLTAVSVVVSGLVTLVDEAFKTKRTCGEFVFADCTGALTVAQSTPTDKPYWRIGMLLETGSQQDARILLSIEPPQRP